MNIAKNLNICGGKACIKGTRIPVYIIFSYIVSGLSNEEILVNYPSLKQSDLDDVLKYAKENPDEVEEDTKQNNLA